MTKLRLLILSLVLLACGPNAQAITANVMASSVNVASAKMLERYEQEGNKAIDYAATPQDARDSLAKVREKWEPVWLALEAFRLSHSLWAEAIEAGSVTDFDKLLAAYCELAAIPQLLLPKVLCSK